MSNVTGTPDTSTRRYQEIIEKVFLDRFTSGTTDVPFERAELTEAAKELGHAVPAIRRRRVEEARRPVVVTTLPAAVGEPPPVSAAVVGS